MNSLIHLFYFFLAIWSTSIGSQMNCSSFSKPLHLWYDFSFFVCFMEVYCYFMDSHFDLFFRLKRLFFESKEYEEEAKFLIFKYHLMCIVWDFWIFWLIKEDRVHQKRDWFISWCFFRFIDGMVWRVFHNRCSCYGCIFIIFNQ